MKEPVRIARGFLCKATRLSSLLVVLCLLSFGLVHLSPVDPVNAYVGADMMRVGPEQRAEIARRWGLGEPIQERMTRWASAVLLGDWGTSAIFRRSVLEVVRERFIASLLLMAGAWVLSGVIGFWLGIVAGAHRDTWIDRLVKWYCLTLASTPTFWLGLLVLIVFSAWLGWFPVGFEVPIDGLHDQVTFWQRIHHAVLPVLTLSVSGVSGVALHTRQKLLDVLESDYILFARARGESGWPLLRNHALRNVALPALTLQFASFSELFGGAVLAEQVFSYPGLGRTTVEASLRGDVPLLLGCVFFSALFVFAGNLMADLLYPLVDPRVRRGGEA